MFYVTLERVKLDVNTVAVGYEGMGDAWKGCCLLMSEQELKEGQWQRRRMSRRGVGDSDRMLEGWRERGRRPSWVSVYTRFALTMFIFVLNYCYFKRSALHRAGVHAQTGWAGSLIWPTLFNFHSFRTLFPEWISPFIDYWFNISNQGLVSI